MVFPLVFPDNNKQDVMGEGMIFLATMDLLTLQSQRIIELHLYNVIDFTGSLSMNYLYQSVCRTLQATLPRNLMCLIPRYASAYWSSVVIWVGA